MKNPVFASTKDFDINVAESNGSMQRQHYHDTYEFYLVLEGSKTLLTDDSRYLLTKGSLAVIEPFMLHMTTAAAGGHCRRYITELSQKALSPLLSETERDELFDGISTCVLSLDEEELRFVCGLFKDAHRYKNIKGPLAGKLTVMVLTYLSDFIRRRSRHGVKQGLKAESRKAEEPVMEALRYINLNYTSPISLERVCGIAHMSRSNFCLAFKKAVGDTFVSYVNTLRVAQAHRLLMTTDLSLSEIAERAGFSSADYFTRVFKSIHGIAPAKLRREGRR